MTNNKQQTAVKLYTEEQLLNTAEAIIDYLKNYPQKFHESMIKKHLTALAPLELPSDEEIKKMMELDGMEFDEFDSYDVSYLGGATWMRNKIQGGEQC
jgi:hypothetical protein